MIFKNIAKISAGLIAVFSLCFMIAFSSTSFAKKFTIKLATVAPDGTPWASHLSDLKKRVKKDSSNNIKIKIFFGGSLGGEIESTRDLRRGRIQGWAGSTSAIAEGARIPQLLLMELPFLFSSFEEADHILDAVIQDDLKKVLADKGFIFGFWHENGWRNFGTKNIPIKTLKDLQTMKMRSQESPVHLAMYKALGVQSESIPVPEVLSALQTGMVDGFDNTPLFSAATGWVEGIKYYTISQHIYQPALVLFSSKQYKKMGEELQKILIGNPEQEATKGRQLIRAMRTDLLNNFKKGGIEVHEIDKKERKVFMDKTRKVHTEFESVIGKKLLQKVYDAQKKFRNK